MDTFLNNKFDLHSYSPLTLAFIGDSVYDLLVREYLLSLGNRPVKELNITKVELVNCKSQADSAKAIMQSLTDEELDVFKRGRNAKLNSVSKHSTVADYHTATGLEALFGYLYLGGRVDRIKELFLLILSTDDPQCDL